MKTYVIYHPFDGQINDNCRVNLFEYKVVAKVEANSLEEAFKKAQNDVEEESGYSEFGVRSTCVGDIIAESSPLFRRGNVYAQNFYMVMPSSFRAVPFTVVTFIDWGNHM